MNHLVTGGTGSIGRGLVKRLLTLKETTSVRVFSRNEYQQYLLQRELADERVRYLIGDIRDAERVKKAAEGVNTIYNAAALKHVPACEYNPFEAVKTNVIGTQNVIEAALANDVSAVVHVSTDKAVSPTSTMGATKLVAERLMLTANGYKGKRFTKFNIARFGNLLASRGSVIPLWVAQMQSGMAITITNPDATRYFATLDTAVESCLAAALANTGGLVYIPFMPLIRIGDIVKALHILIGNGRELRYKTIGLQAGEKLHEELHTEGENIVRLKKDKNIGMLTQGEIVDLLMKDNLISELLTAASEVKLYNGDTNDA